MRKISVSAILFIIVSEMNSTAQTVEWKDVAAIFYDNCATCHRPGEIGEDRLNAMGYYELTSSGYFYSIPTQISARTMPPWPADPNYQHFLDERILTQDQIDLVNKFVDQVANDPYYDPGDLSEAPDPPQFVEGSQLGTPDTVVTMAEPFIIPGDNTDRYQVFVLHTNLTENREVQAIEFRPGNPKVVHHVFIYTCTDGSADSLDATTPEYGYASFGGAGDGVNVDFLTLHGPGLIPRFYPEGCGIKFKPGTAIVIQVHYAPSEVEQTDQSSVNIFYGDDIDFRAVKGKRVGEDYVMEPVFFIVKNKELTFHSEYPLDTTYSMFSIAPHMHLLGTKFKIWAVTPAQDSIPLCYINKWDFRWQMLYNFNNFVILPQGTIIKAEATYDNTVNNPNNPNNPPENVGYGESSFDEMFKYFMNLVVYEPGDEDVIFDTTWSPVGIPPVEGIVMTPQLYAPFPNPANDQTIFHYYLPHSSSTTRIYVYDLSGKLAMPLIEEGSESSGFHRKTIYTDELHTGSYFFTLEADGKRVTKPFIVQH